MPTSTKLPFLGRKKPHKLKENKKTRTPRVIIAVDTETYQEEIDKDFWVHKVRLAWAIYKDRQTGKTEYFYFETVENFWVWLKSKLKHKYTLYVFAHNFDFDWQVLQGFKMVKEVLGGEITRAIFDSNVFHIKVRVKGFDGYPDHRCNIEFISTTNYTPYPLKKIGKIIGIEKMEIDFKTANKEYLKEYCKRDTEILLAFVEYLLKFIQQHDLGNFQPTIAGQSFTAFRHRFMKYDIYIHAKPKATELERLSYKGGRTEACFIGKWKGKVYKLDINSMYPFVMRKHEYPTKLVKVLPYASVSQLKRIMEKYLVIARMKVKVYKPVVGVKRTKLIFPIGVFEDVFTSPEIELIMRYGEILQVKEVAIYEKAPIFVEYVDYFYDLRQRFKQEGNEVMQYFAKIFMNSLYGKFGQRNEYFRKIGEYPKEEYVAIRYYDADNKKWGYYRIIGNKIEEKDGYVEGENSFVAIASFVTAYARCYLWELIEKAGEENVLYMDTDSLFVTEKGFENLKDFIHDKELGKLKVEGVTDDLEIWGAKNYRIGNEIKRKGIRKDAKQIDDRTYEQIQFIRVRSNLLKYHLDGAGMMIVRKTLRSEYDKGVILPNGRVKPLYLNES